VRCANGTFATYKESVARPSCSQFRSNCEVFGRNRYDPIGRLRSGAIELRCLIQVKDATVLVVGSNPAAPTEYLLHMPTLSHECVGQIPNSTAGRDKG
jgi:hypothetical protein